jgi:hypothetical protein
VAERLEHLGLELPKRLAHAEIPNRGMFTAAPILNMTPIISLNIRILLPPQGSMSAEGPELSGPPDARATSSFLDSACLAKHANGRRGWCERLG